VKPRGDGSVRASYREAARRIRQALRPMEPRQEFSRRLEDLCRSMGAEEVLLEIWERQEENRKRHYLIGGAIFSALPFMGMVAYALSRYISRRRAVPIGA
jgi:acyl-coenzyme A thioesterase PaaI-like protein